MEDRFLSHTFLCLEFKLFRCNVLSFVREKHFIQSWLSTPNNPCLLIVCWLSIIFQLCVSFPRHEFASAPPVFLMTITT